MRPENIAKYGINKVIFAVMLLFTSMHNHATVVRVIKSPSPNVDYISGDRIVVGGQMYQLAGVRLVNPTNPIIKTVSRDVIAHTEQNIILTDELAGYGPIRLAYLEPLEKDSRTSNEVLIAADLAEPSTFEDPPEDVKRAAMQKTYRILHGIDDDEYIKNIRGLVRNLNSATNQ